MTNDFAVPLCLYNRWDLCVVFEDGRNKGGWNICISNMGNCKSSSLVTPNAGKPNYSFNFECLTLRQDLASELDKCSCLISWPAWDISIPVGAVLFSADFVSLHKGQVKLFWSQLTQVQPLQSAKLVQIIFDQRRTRCKEREQDLACCTSLVQHRVTHPDLLMFVLALLTVLMKLPVKIITGISHLDLLSLLCLFHNRVLHFQSTQNSSVQCLIVPSALQNFFKQ